MEHALFARIQMGMSLGFHIIFASIGMTMPILMVISEALWLRTKNPEYLALTKAWAKGTAVFFAIGAVSGTVLAFELGLLFPTFMKHAGAVIGLPFALEGFAFFTEAIFLGIYLYGWEKVKPGVHLFAGVIVSLSGTLSAAFVTTANAWMNCPTGVRMVEGKLVDIDPIQAMLSPFIWHEIPHTILASYVATGFAVAGIHAYVLLKHGQSFFHRRALAIALAVGVPCALLQPIVGHFAGQQVARYQPLKFAAIEDHRKTERGAGFKLFGEVKIPKLLSFLATNNPDAEIKGLEEFPREDWPPILAHYSFRLMIACGSLLFLFSLWALWLRERIWDSPRFLKVMVGVAPLGYLATEAGWIATEVGRQPWTIYGFLRTNDAITTVGGIFGRLCAFSAIYAVLGFTTLWILSRYVRATR